jgi:hypothetical protein
MKSKFVSSMTSKLGNSITGLAKKYGASDSTIKAVKNIGTSVKEDPKGSGTLAVGALGTTALLGTAEVMGRSKS